MYSKDHIKPMHRAMEKRYYTRNNFCLSVCMSLMDLKMYKCTGGFIVYILHITRIILLISDLESEKCFAAEQHLLYGEMSI